MAWGRWGEDFTHAESPGRATMIKLRIVTLPGGHCEANGFVGEVHLPAIEWAAASIKRAILEWNSSLVVETSHRKPDASEVAQDYLIWTDFGAARWWLDILVHPHDMFRSTKEAEGDSHERYAPILDLFEKIRLEYSRIMVSCNLAVPGSLRTLGMALWNDQELVLTQEGHAHFLADEIMDSERYAWPPVASLDFDSVRNWLLSHLTEDSWHAESRCGRALAAFTHLLKGDMSDEAKVMWYSAALEALYCDSNEGVKRQLFEKSQALLGEITQHKKTIRAIYDVRSSLFHGGASFPFGHSTDYWSDEPSPYSKNLGSTIAIMARMLVATFQKMVQLNKHDLEFRYILA